MTKLPPRHEVTIPVPEFIIEPNSELREYLEYQSVREYVLDTPPIKVKGDLSEMAIKPHLMFRPERLILPSASELSMRLTRVLRWLYWLSIGINIIAAILWQVMGLDQIAVGLFMMAVGFIPVIARRIFNRILKRHLFYISEARKIELLEKAHAVKTPHHPAVSRTSAEP